MGVDIRFLVTDQIDKVIQFFTSAQSDSVRQVYRSRKEFDWLFLDGIYKPALYCVASDSETEEIVGTTASIFIPMLSPSGDLLLTLKSEDTLLSLDHMIKLRKRDLLEEMLNRIEERAINEKVSFIWGFTIAGNSFKRAGFTVSNQIQGSFFVVRPIQFYRYRIAQFPVQSTFRRIKLFVFACYNCFRQRSLSLTFTQFSINRVTLDEIDEGNLLSLLPKNVFTIQITKEFLGWRITENPSSMAYGFLEVRDKKSLIIAYLIYSFNKENIYFVEQFLFISDLPDGTKIKVMRSAFSLLKKKNVTAIRAIGFTDNFMNRKEIYLLKKAGFYFFENRKSNYFIFKNLTDSNLNTKDIYLSRLNTLGTV